jgi:hypothetical protein
MGINIETGIFEVSNKNVLQTIAAPSVTGTSVILITLELKEGGEKECYINVREPGVGFTIRLENKEPHTHLINWAVIN